MCSCKPNWKLIMISSEPLKATTSWFWYHELNQVSYTSFPVSIYQVKVFEGLAYSKFRYDALHKCENICKLVRVLIVVPSHWILCTYMYHVRKCFYTNMYDLNDIMILLFSLSVDIFYCFVVSVNYDRDFVCLNSFNNLREPSSRYNVYVSSFSFVHLILVFILLLLPVP